MYWDKKEEIIKKRVVAEIQKAGEVVRNAVVHSQRVTRTTKPNAVEEDIMGVDDGLGGPNTISEGEVIRIVERTDKAVEGDFHFHWNTLAGEELGFSIELPPESLNLVKAGATLVVTKVKNGRPVAFEEYTGS